MSWPFAPGFRERIVGQASYGPACLAAANPNFAGGDIITGANDVRHGQAPCGRRPGRRLGQ